MLLENDFLRVEINEAGAEIRGIYNKKNNSEVMWNGDSAWWGRVSPVLFPFVGALRNGVYRYNGIEYPMTAHGFLRDKALEIESVIDNEVWYYFVSNEETKVNYPFDFKVWIGYKLTGNKVDVLWRIENQGTTDMYYSIGAHPAFLANEGDIVSFESNGTTHRYPLVEGGIGRAYPEEAVDLRIEADAFKNNAVIYDNVESVSLSVNKTNTDIKVTFPNFEFVGIWSQMIDGKMAPFVCIEPWLGIADEFDFEGSLEDKKGIQKLLPKEVNAFNYSVEIDS